MNNNINNLLLAICPTVLVDDFEGYPSLAKTGENTTNNSEIIKINNSLAFLNNQSTICIEEEKNQTITTQQQEDLNAILADLYALKSDIDPIEMTTTYKSSVDTVVDQESMPDLSLVWSNANLDVNMEVDFDLLNNALLVA